MPTLTPNEVRVLGSLIEKQITTPEYYPLTLNALRQASNQTSSRNPVVSLDDRTVEAALTTLREKGLVRIVHSVHNRATKYRHVADEQLRLDDRQQALLTVLLLRGAQTAGELRTRTDRMASFDALADVEGVIDGLADRDEPLVARIERQAGQKDARYVHLLGAAADGHTAEAVSSAARPDGPAQEHPAGVPAGGRADELAERLAALEARVAALEDRLA